MAKGSGIGEIIGLGIAGVGVWWVGGMFGWWSGFGTPAPSAAIPVTTTPVPASTPAPVSSSPSTPAPVPVVVSTPAATVSLVSAVNPDINNSLKATFSINGVQQSLAVIPGGGAYNDAGQDVTAQLAAQGVTPAQLYAMLTAAYKPATGTAGGAGMSGFGMGGPMVFAVQKNYVRRGAGYR